MSQTQRFRPGGENPLRYQGNLCHYHVAPLKSRVWRGQATTPKMEGRKSRRSRRASRFGPGLLAVAGTLVVLAAVAGIVWIGIAG